MENTNKGFFFTLKFLPLFITQFLGAFNDNLFRAAILMIITFSSTEGGTSIGIMNNIAIGLFMLPYFIFSALAGQLADKFEKSTQIFWIKVWEIALMVAGAYAFYVENVVFLIVILSGLGLQSTFFGPIKYAMLPDLMKKSELLSANALFEAGTFIAILLGTTIGAFVVASQGGLYGISLLTIGVAVVGAISSRYVPKTGRAAPQLVIQKNIFMSTGQQIKKAWSIAYTRRAIICISWIWMYGAIYTTQMPVVAKQHLNGNEDVVTLFMALFTLGIGIGSALCSKLLKGSISAKLATPCLLLLTVLGTILFLLLPPVSEATELLTISAFLSDVYNWIILILLVAIAALAGMTIVPMYTILQEKSDTSERSRMIAANNVVNSGFMVIGSLIATVILSFGFSTAIVLLILGFANFLVMPSASKLNKSL